jgi:hypothetical protein
MVGLFCKSCFGAKLVSCPVCYRALFVQVKPACIGLFRMLSELWVFVLFSTLFLVIYIHAAPFRFIRSWVGEETGVIGLWWSGFCGWQRQWVECGLWIVLWCLWRSASCYQHIISFVQHMRIPWWNVNGLSFYARSLLASVQTADWAYEHNLCVKSERSFFSQLYRNMESNQANFTPSVQQSVKKCARECYLFLAFTFVHVLTQVVCCYAPFLLALFG